LKQRTIT